MLGARLGGQKIPPMLLRRADGRRAYPIVRRNLVYNGGFNRCGGFDRLVWYRRVLVHIKNGGFYWCSIEWVLLV
jgi:hypothetical protein